MKLYDTSQFLCVGVFLPQGNSSYNTKTFEPTASWQAVFVACTYVKHTYRSRAHEPYVSLWSTKSHTNTLVWKYILPFLPFVEQRKLSTRLQLYSLWLLQVKATARWGAIFTRNIRENSQKLILVVKSKLQLRSLCMQIICSLSRTHTYIICHLVFQHQNNHTL